MRDFVTGVTVDKYEWALTEDVRVTLVDTDPDQDNHSTYLVERLHPAVADIDPQPRALVLMFRGEMILINGQFIDLGEEMMSWCGLADTVWQDSGETKIGDSVIAEADRS
jgi:hypothetical protein